MTKLDRYFYIMLAAGAGMIAVQGEVGAASVFLVAAVAIDLYKDSRND